MPTISVITAVLDGSHEFINESFESLVEQELPSGWSWQWVVQEDGETGRPLAAIPDDPRISKGQGKRGRAASARTLALARATGVLVRTLDADDKLPPGALRRDIEALANNPDIGWCVSPAVDLYPDGSILAGPRDPDPGPLRPGFLADGERAGMLQVVGTTMCAYTELVRCLGGWQALPTEEDVALVLAVEAVSPGWMLDEPGLIYRKWSGQTTAGRDPAAASPGSESRGVILDRVRALKAAGWRWSPPADSMRAPHPSAVTWSEGARRG